MRKFVPILIASSVLLAGNAAFAGTVVDTSINVYFPDPFPEPPEPGPPTWPPPGLPDDPNDPHPDIPDPT